MKYKIIVNLSAIKRNLRAGLVLKAFKDTKYFSSILSELHRW